MAGPNTTGTPNTADYNIGRGIVYFASLVNSLPVAFRDLGNASAFKISIASEKVEHKSSRLGLKVTDKEVIISQTATVSLTLDEINHQNLALIFSGGTATHTNVAVDGFSERVMVADGQLALGRWYDITNASNERAYDIDAADLTVTTNETVPVALAKDTDYTVDIEMGRIFTLSTSTKLATSIAAGKGLKVTLAAKAEAKAVNEVRGLTSTNVVGCLKFIASNPADNDKQTEYTFHQISLKPDGDFSLIGDEFTTMSFTGVAEANATADADSPTLTVRTVASA